MANEEKKKIDTPAMEKAEKKDAGAQYSRCGCTWSTCGRLVAIPGDPICTK